MNRLRGRPTVRGAAKTLLCAEPLADRSDPDGVRRPRAARRAPEIPAGKAVPMRSWRSTVVSVQAAPAVSTKGPSLRRCSSRVISFWKRWFRANTLSTMPK